MPVVICLSIGIIGSVDHFTTYLNPISSVQQVQTCLDRVLQVQKGEKPFNELVEFCRDMFGLDVGLRYVVK